MNPYVIASAILATILTLAGAGIYLFVRQTEVSGTPSVFEARVTLRNTCDVGDDYFVVRVIGTGQISRFRNRETVLRVMKGDRLRLEIAPGFPEVKYSGYDEPARAKVELVADCDSTERQQMINRSMRDAFGK